LLKPAKIHAPFYCHLVKEAAAGRDNAILHLKFASCPQQISGDNFNMSVQEMLIEEIKHQPEPVVREILRYLKSLERQNGTEAPDRRPDRRHLGEAWAGPGSGVISGVASPALAWLPEWP
jgi:hypothetical protein